MEESSWTVTITQKSDGSYIVADDTGHELMISGIVGRMLRNFCTMFADAHKGDLIVAHDGEVL